ncbi:MAG: SHOCT domain-containing protein [Eubacteriales bacterium]
MELFGNVILPMNPFWGMGIIGTLLSVLVMVIVIRMIIRAAHGDYRSHRERRMDYAAQTDASYEARRILDERYAKGEIGDEEYRQKKENLR